MRSCELPALCFAQENLHASAVSRNHLSLLRRLQTMGLPELPVLGSPSDEFPLTGGVIEIRAKGECSAAFRAFRGLPENKSVTDNPAGSVVFHIFASFPLKVLSSSAR